MTPARVVGSAVDLATVVGVAILLVVTPSAEGLDAMPLPMPPVSLTIAEVSRSEPGAPGRAATTFARSAIAVVPTLTPGTDFRTEDDPLPRVAAASSGELPGNGVRRAVYMQSQSDDLRDYVLRSAATLQRRAWVGHGTAHGNALASAGATGSD